MEAHAGQHLERKETARKELASSRCVGLKDVWG